MDERLQNEKLIYTVNMPDQRAPQIGLKAKKIYEEKSNTYVEVTDDLHFLEDGSGFVLTSERSGWNHIYRCPMDGGEPQAITSGEYDVLAVQGVDERSKRVIFTASQKDLRNRRCSRYRFRAENRHSFLLRGG